MAGTIPTHGAISLLLMQQKFGGSNPISASEYYRGKRVPATISSHSNVAQKFLKDLVYAHTQYFYMNNLTGSFAGKSNIAWAMHFPTHGSATGDEYFKSVAGATTSIASKKHHGRVYHRGKFQKALNIFGLKSKIYSIYYSTGTTISNSHVPTSGRISFSQWRGAHYK
jgi:hypothetical protein